VPLAAAAVPVWRGTGVSVRRALADFGVAANSFGTSRFDRMLTGVSGLARPLLLAIRNNFCRRGRLALTVLTLAAGGLFFMTALNVRASMIRTLDRLFEGKKYDLSLTIAGMAQVGEVDRIVRATPGVRAAEAWIASEGTVPQDQKAGQAFATTQPHSAGAAHGVGVSGDRFLVIALPPQTKLLAPAIDSGRWLAAAENDTIVINTALAAKRAQMKVGNRVTFPMGPGTVTFRVVGVARESFSPPTAYIPRAFFDEIAGHTGITNNVRLVLDKNDAESIERVKGLLEDNFGREGIKVTGMTSKGESRFGFDQHMLMIYVALIVMSAMIGGVGGLGLMTTISLNVLERRREMGVLRAVGATPRALWLMLVVEGTVVGVLSWAIAGFAAWPLSRGLGYFLATTMIKSALDFSFELRGLVVWLAISLLLGAMASFVPARHAAQLSVKEALSYE